MTRHATHFPSCHRFLHRFLLLLWSCSVFLLLHLFFLFFCTSFSFFSAPLFFVVVVVQRLMEEANAEESKLEARCALSVGAASGRLSTVPTGRQKMTNRTRRLCAGAGVTGSTENWTPTRIHPNSKNSPSPILARKAAYRVRLSGTLEIFVPQT